MAQKKNRELRFCSAELRASDVSGGARTLSGYAALFNSSSVDLGGWTEVISPNAFTKSLRENPDVVLLRDHDTGILLGRTSSKTLQLSEDATGLRFTCQLPATTQAADLAVMIDRGDISGCSFGFVCNLDDWSNDQDGNTVRKILEAELYDVSIVANPAYQDTSVSLRAAPVEIRSVIEARVKPAQDPACNCVCAECQDGDCAQCLDPDCADEFCSCAEMKFRNRAHMIVELARHRAA